MRFMMRSTATVGDPMDMVVGTVTTCYNYGYNGYGGNGYRHAERPQRQGKTYKEICRVHYPDAVAFPGAGGVVCPY
uniref:Uncharacterized protein n=1 Tax=Papilio xuthus TaxID=66420 RepID=I4DND1_PAPXU|nr:unknown unsecreted protein [Papilio xuthus]